MTDQKSGNLLWLDRLGMSVPGYAGYKSQAQRRAAAFALRDAITHRLQALAGELESARTACERLNATREITSLERVGRHLALLRTRVAGLGTRFEHFYSAPDFSTQVVNPIHAIDLALMEKADELLNHFEHPDSSHNLLANLEADLQELEMMLDQRALMLQGTLASASHPV